MCNQKILCNQVILIEVASCSKFDETVHFWLLNNCFCILYRINPFQGNKCSFGKFITIIEMANYI